jgi:hypothetical protein
MSDSHSPFTSLEAAHEYVGLLLEAVQQTRGDVALDLAAAQADGHPRRSEALQRVAWKLERLEQQLEGSRRVMHDLRRLRRLLLGESDEDARAARDAAAAPDGAARAPGAGEEWEDS